MILLYPVAQAGDDATAEGATYAPDEPHYGSCRTPGAL
jgi:hypothetical protein